MQNRPRRCAAVAVTLLVVLAAAPRAALSQAEDLPPERQVPILARALAYDENLRNRAGDELVLAVLSKAGNHASDKAADAVSHALQGLVGIKVQGIPLRATRLSFTTAAALGDAIHSQGIDALYVAPGLESDLASVVGVTRQHHVLSLGSREDQITKGGVSLGVFLVEGRPTIYVNLSASKAEGAAFSSDLLRLANVVR